MVSALGELVLAKICGNFSEHTMQIQPEPGVLVAFPTKHKKAGNISLQDNHSEIIFCISSFHYHFDSKANTLSEQEIADEVVAFLKSVFADEIEFCGTYCSAGFRKRSNKKRGWLSRCVYGKETYVWSDLIASVGDK